MIRGCRRRMVIVSGSKDSSFETAYFVLKDSADENSVGDDDVMKMANSLIESCYSDTSSDRDNKGKYGRRGAWFLFGFFTGMVTSVVVALLIFI